MKVRAVSMITQPRRTKMTKVLMTGAESAELAGAINTLAALAVYYYGRDYAEVAERRAMEIVTKFSKQLENV